MTDEITICENCGNRKDFTKKGECFNCGGTKKIKMIDEYEEY